LREFARGGDLIDPVIMPPPGLILGCVDFSNLVLNLAGKSEASLADAKGPRRRNSPAAPSS
jgi:hypothetical protein